MRIRMMNGMAAGRVWMPALLLGLLMATGLEAARAQEGDAAAGGAETSRATQEAATAAFNELFASAEQRLMSAGPRLKAVRQEVIVELEAFAKAHPATAAAAVSLENAGSLAQAVGELDRAEGNLREALLHRPPQEIHGRIAYALSDLIALPGREVRDFTAETIDGESVSPEGLKGKVVLLDFWATWCGPCIAELPNVQQAYTAYREQGFEIVSISVDQDRGELTRFLKANEMPWKHVFDEDRPREQRLAERFGVFGIPHTILVGKDGKIVAKDLRGAALGEAVGKALGG